MRERTFKGLSSSGFHRVAYTEWGDPANPRVLICVHGLTRNGRDFDLLAAAMCDRYRVICPDIVGRGKSEWLVNSADYVYPQYLADMTALIARSGAEQVDWLGTSMGGIMGILLAAQHGSPIRRLVSNDAGALVPKAAIERIVEYVGKDPEFNCFEDFRSYIKATSLPFGLTSDEQWDRAARVVAKYGTDGRVQCNYDPGISHAFATTAVTDVDLSTYWKNVTCPVLVIRGALSDLLLPGTYAAMLAKPGVTGVEIPHVGHAPMFMDDAQIQIVRDYLIAG